MYLCYSLSGWVCWSVAEGWLRSVHVYLFRRVRPHHGRLQLCVHQHACTCMSLYKIIFKLYISLFVSGGFPCFMMTEAGCKVRGLHNLEFVLSVHVQLRVHERNFFTDLLLNIVSVGGCRDRCGCHLHVPSLASKKQQGKERVIYMYSH